MSQPIKKPPEYDIRPFVPFILVIILVFAIFSFSGVKIQEVRDGAQLAGKQPPSVSLGKQVATIAEKRIFAVTAPRFNNTFGADAGKVYVYEIAESYLGRWKPAAVKLRWSAEGAASDDTFGRSVDILDDVNGDGKSDIVVGAAKFGILPLLKGDYVSVFSGANGALLWKVLGENPQFPVSQCGSYFKNDHFGQAVSNVPDADFDGIDDVVVGAPGYHYCSFTGKIYLFSGATGNLIWSKEGDNVNDKLGWAVKGIKDLNGDGAGDVVASTDKANYVKAYSGVDGSVIWTLYAEPQGGFFGYDVSPVQDLNGDGIQEIIVGDIFFNGSGGSSSGKIYVYSGAEGSLIWSEEGESASDSFGFSVSDIADANKDGFSDIAVGAYAYDGTSVYIGKLYVYSGIQQIPGNPVSLWSKTGTQPYEFFGWDVRGLTDGNNDRIGDVIVGVPNYDGVAGADSGRAHIFSGFNGQLIWQKEGENFNDLFGHAVAGD